jgi:hypothetical protein
MPVKKHVKHKKIEENAIRISKKSFYIIAALIIIAIIYFIYSSSKGDVAATVNGEKIYSKRIDALYNSLPSGSNMTKSQVLQRLIDTKILVDYAKTKGFDISNDAFKKELDNRLVSSGISKNDFDKELSLLGATLEDVKDTFIIESFVNTAILPAINVTNEVILKYRNSAPEKNLTDEQIKNILIGAAQKQIIANILASHKNSMDIVLK